MIFRYWGPVLILYIFLYTCYIWLAIPRNLRLFKLLGYWEFHYDCHFGLHRGNLSIAYHTPQIFDLHLTKGRFSQSLWLAGPCKVCGIPCLLSQGSLSMYHGIWPHPSLYVFMPGIPTRHLFIRKLPESFAS